MASIYDIHKRSGTLVHLQDHKFLESEQKAADSAPSACQAAGTECIQSPTRFIYISGHIGKPVSSVDTMLAEERNQKLRSFGPPCIYCWKPRVILLLSS